MQPQATYRIQLNAGFTFDDAAAQVDYLSRLGITHLYLSPILQAAPGSTHGYDVVDPTRVNAELGGAPGFDRLQAGLADANLGILLDVVPNHMAISRENRWWWDVLEDGQASRYARFFDVDWDSPVFRSHNRVLLPILGDHYGRELEAGRIQIRREGASFTVVYYEHTAPISPQTLDVLLREAAARLHPPTPELEDLADRFAEAGGEDKEPLRIRLAELGATRPDVYAAIDEAVAATNRDPDALDAILDRQHYRLAWWRIAAEEVDYRRFFDINELAAIRVEDPAVFTASHGLILAWLTSGVIDGVRIDHIDGLLDPQTYLERLRRAAPQAWIVVEKILATDETLPQEWPIAGTTGYDWLNRVGDWLIDASGAERMLHAYRAFTRVEDRYEEAVHLAKRELLDTSLAADVRRLVRHFRQVCERDRRYRDYTDGQLQECLLEVAAAFGVYRTYIRPGAPPSADDVAVMEGAVLSAGLRRPELDPQLLEFFRDVQLLRTGGGPGLELAQRFQQLTGPAMAKAVEDTAFYRYLPLVGRNDVGGNPGQLDADVERFHQTCETHTPDGLLALSTHDTKRSEDVRARLAVLAEMPEEWALIAHRWRQHHQRRRTVVLPDANTEWLIYQTLVGAWPLDAPRLAAYVAKATREAKEHTSWTDPDQVYDDAVARFVREALTDASFTADVEAVVATVRRAGWVNSLAQKLLTLTAPGVADLYQGSELWDWSLVDPDNRRPVDYARRRQLLDRAEATSPIDAWRDEDGSGLAKLIVVRAALGLRRSHPEWFSPGSYQRLPLTGTAGDHAVAFCRGGGAVTVAPRFPLRLAASGGWCDTVLTLPPGEWLDQFHGRRHEGVLGVAELLDDFPVGLLARS